MGVMATTYACPFEETCETDCAEVDVGEYLRVAVDPRSRQLLSVLRPHVGEDLSLEFVLDQLSANGEDDRQSWDVELHHVSLPMLEDLGIAEYDREASVVRYLGCPLVDASTDLVEAN
jgi:hypothetical protein